MTIQRCLSDFDHPVVAGKAQQLISGRHTPLEKLESLFLFVRDGIRFGFPPVWDEATASEVIGCGVGYCNTKATLLRALCRAAGIPAKLHFGLIDLRVMRGIIPSVAFPFLPRAAAHSWTEVQLGGQWRPIDSYINDRRFFRGALARLQASGRPVGYSLAPIGGRASCDLNFGEKGFVHMGAVVEDHGEWDDAGEYFASDRYRRRSATQAKLYPTIAFLANRKIGWIRWRSR